MIINILLTILNFFRFLLSYVVPKEKGKWLFMPTHNKGKLSGNVKALLDYTVNQENKDLSIEVLISSKASAQYLQNASYVKIINNYFEAFVAILRAEYIIVDAIPKEFIKGKYSIIQLWHGVGFKNIALLDNHLKEKKRKEYSRFFKKMDFVIASSQDDLNRKNKSFNIDRTIITGMPRNDVFLDRINEVDKIKNQLNLNGYNRVILYAPTFREIVTSLPFQDRFWEKLNNIMVKNNEIFIIKKHPWDTALKLPNSYSHIRDLSNDVSEVQNLLLISNLLITDYSGIVTDFVLTNNPVLIYAYDLKDYLINCRSMYYDLEEILPKPFIWDEETLLKKIRERNWEKDREYLESYKKFKNRFHNFQDNQSSRRVYEHILSLK